MKQGIKKGKTNERRKDGRIRRKGRKEGRLNVGKEVWKKHAYKLIPTNHHHYATLSPLLHPIPEISTYTSFRGQGDAVG